MQNYISPFIIICTLFKLRSNTLSNSSSIFLLFMPSALRAVGAQSLISFSIPLLARIGACGWPYFARTINSPIPSYFYVPECNLQRAYRLSKYLQFCWRLIHDARIIFLIDLLCFILVPNKDISVVRTRYYVLIARPVKIDFFNGSNITVTHVSLSNEFSVSL